MFIRLLNISVVVTTILLILTGLRIWLFNQSILPPIYLSWIDSIHFGGNIFNQHLILGYALLGLIVLKSSLSVWRLVRIKERRNGNEILRRIKQSIELALLTLLGALIVSGFSLFFKDFDNTITLSTYQNIHVFSTWGVIILGLVFVAVSLLSRSTNQQTDAVAVAINESSWVWVIASLTIAVAAVWLVFQFVEKPIVLVSKNMYRIIALNGMEGIEWTGADSVMVNVSGGDNFSGGNTKIKIKSFHSRTDIHFLFQWRDWEPSHNRSLEKTTDGWRELKSEYSPFGESVYFEDQLAISFHTDKSGCAQSCHLGGDNRPGLHYTKGDTADLWVWQAVSTNPAWEADDGWLGEYLNDSIGGRHYDNSPGGGNASNLNEEWDEPYFLPGPLSFGNWIWMESDRYVPYRAGLDNYRIGSTLPSRLVHRFSGDRGDLRARAQWRNGMWTLEMTRKVKTGSPIDMALRTECWLGVAVFNNAELKHAYHLKPIKLVIEK